MKNKIVWRLSGYFALSLLVFALIISGVFILLFRSSAIELNKADLEKRAQNIASTLSLAQNAEMGKGQGGGYGAYIKFIDDIAMADVWVVDQNLNIITYGIEKHTVSTTSDLPSNAKEIVDAVFKGNTEFSEGFSNLLDTPSLTVGTPIKSSGGEIIGAVLLHSPVDGVDTAISNGIIILGVSIGAALLIAFILSVLLSLGFTKPLSKMNLAAIKLTNGDYTVKTNVQQNDEIGTLAKNMDILSVRLLEASKESENLEKLRRDFVSNISHELRTPVTVIRGSLEALSDGVVTDELKTKEYYSQMLSESKHLQRLINDLLDLSRLQNIDFKLEMAHISLCDVISDVIRSAKTLAADKNIEILLENDAKECQIFGDYGRLRQMIMIIMDNAIKFSPQNGHINVKISKNEKLVLSIRDEGPGISAEDLPYIFDRFYKTKSEENKTGTGLGLAIAQQIALRHDIEINVQSELKHGCEFIFIFRLAKD